MIRHCSEQSKMLPVFVANLLILYLEATEEVSLDSPEREPVLSSEPSPAVTPVTPTALIAPRIESKSISAPVIFDRSREEVGDSCIPNPCVAGIWLLSCLSLLINTSQTFWVKSVGLKKLGSRTIS